MKAYENLAQYTIVLRLHVNGGLVRLLRLFQNTISTPWVVTERRGRRTISRSTSPAANDSPSFFFHDAIPPSVMVGDIAGIANFETA